MDETSEIFIADCAAASLLKVSGSTETRTTALETMTGAVGALVGTAVGVWVVGALVVGALVVGALVVGPAVVGDLVVGALVVGALLVGASVGRALAAALAVPAVGVHHMEGHLLAPLLEEEAPDFPFVALLVSGGHSMLVEVSSIGKYRVLGETRDDAAGEAFDKTAKLLGLGYPGGPVLAKAAESGDPGRYSFPRPMTDRPGLEFSFSGLKTHTRNLWRKHGAEANAQADIAAGFQLAVVDTLVIKCRRAMKQTRSSHLVIAGGVGANLHLREALQQAGRKYGWGVSYPRIEFCTDNGAMIAFAGYHRLRAGQFEAEIIRARPRWPLAELRDLS